jgi:hypothetical protein
LNPSPHGYVSSEPIPFPNPKAVKRAAKIAKIVVWQKLNSTKAGK